MTEQGICKTCQYDNVCDKLAQAYIALMNVYKGKYHRLYGSYNKLFEILIRQTLSEDDLGEILSVIEEE